MKKRVCLSLVAFFTIAAFLLLIPTSADSPGLLAEQGIRPASPVGALNPASREASARIESSYGRLPLSFEPNQGQTSRAVKFLSRGHGYSLFLTNDEAVLALRSGVEESARKGDRTGTRVHPASNAVLRMKLAGANLNAKVTGVDELPGKSNYLIGKNSKKWHTNIPNYAKVRYQNVYPGIDLVYYGNQRQLEYDFVVSSGADPKVIALEITGRKGTPHIKLAKNGDLVIKTGGGEVRFHKPVVYQAENSGARTPSRKPIEGRFVLLAENRIVFEVSSYDAAKPLYIDPVISYATYLGSPGVDSGNGIAVDDSGSAYITGETYSPYFPALPSTLPPQDMSTVAEAFVTKLSSDGTSLIYSTFLGGTSHDRGVGISLDSIGNAYVTGQTRSVDFPTTSGAYQKNWGGGICTPPPGDINPGCWDVFLTKLDASGSNLLYSTYLGGSDQDVLNVKPIAVDTAGNAYVGGMTQSSDFPTVNAIQPVFHDGTCGPPGGTFPCPDGFVAKINPSAAGAASLVYSTYLGGSQGEQVNSLALDGSGNVYAVGSTGSEDFPTTAGAFQTTLAGPGDAFVTKINTTGTAYVYSTFLGGSNGEGGGSIAVGSSGNAFATGVTSSIDFPTTEGAFDTTCGSDGQCNGSNDGYVVELNVEGSKLVYSTYLGGSGNDVPNGIAVDAMGIAYVVGNTHSADFPTANCHCGFGGDDSGNSFLSKLSAGGETLIVSINLGEGGASSANGIALDSSRNAYATGMTWSPMFSTTPGAFQEQLAGPPDAFVIKLSDLAVDAEIFSAESLDFGEQLVGTTSDVMSVTVKNVGDAALAVPPLDASGDFQMTSNCGSSIDPGTSCTLDVTFTPQDIGTKTGALRGYDEESGEWGEFFPLTGVGIAPALDVSPLSLNFNEQKVGTTSEAQTVTVTNAGSVPVTISDLKAPASFTVTNNCGSAVAAGGSCTLDVVFAPTATGSVTEPVTITYVGAGSPLSITVTGTGTAPAITASPTSLSFEDQSVGSTSDTQTITLTNTGTGTANFSSIKSTGDFALTDNCGGSLAAGENCTLEMAFSPTVAGSATGQVTIAYDGADSPVSIELTGAGIAPSLSVSPSSLSFDSQLIDSTSKSKTITVTNTGGAPVNISSVQGSTHFANTHNCGTSLDPGKSCTMNVTFAPKAAGLLTEQILINHDGSGSPNTITLTGQGTDFAIQTGSGGSSASVEAGQSATYNLSVNPTGFSGEVEMKCQWYHTVPGGTSCSVSPSVVNLDGTQAANVVMTITTTSRGMAPVLRGPQSPGPGGYPVSHLVMWLLALTAVVSLIARRRRVTVSLASLLFLVTLWAACGGSAPRPLLKTGTAAGTYSLSVVGTTTLGPVEEYPTYVTRSTALMTLEVK